MGRATQGEVYRTAIRRSIGFDVGSDDAHVLVVVVQGNALNAVIETLVVAPLVPASEERGRFPLHVRVPGAELGGRSDHVAKVHLLRPIALSRLAPGPESTVSAATLARLLAAVARVFR